MDLLEDPMFKVRYQKSKLKVKLWESEFRKAHGRNPSKVATRSKIKFCYWPSGRVHKILKVFSFVNVDGVNLPRCLIQN
jgi:hypothetical protein